MGETSKEIEMELKQKLLCLRLALGRIMGGGAEALGEAERKWNVCQYIDWIMVYILTNNSKGTRQAGSRRRIPVSRNRGGNRPGEAWGCRKRKLRTHTHTGTRMGPLIETCSHARSCRIGECKVRHQKHFECLVINVRQLLASQEYTYYYVWNRGWRGPCRSRRWRWRCSLDRAVAEAVCPRCVTRVPLIR